MIQLTRLHGEAIMVNEDLIESIEQTPDTVLTLTSGNKIVVREPMKAISDAIVEFKRKIYGPPLI
jgi:flagellar protein FlbD